MGGKPPVRLAGDREPWERQPAETLRMYSRFQVFLELGRTRTLTQAAEMLHSMGDRIGYRTLRQYSYEWRWVARAEARDAEQDRLDLQRLVLQRREMRERHVRIASGLQAKAITRLTALQPETLTPLDLVRFVRLAAALERAALGEPETTVGVSSPSGGPVQVEDFGAYAPGERAARLAEISAELARRAAALVDTDDDTDDDDTDAG